MAYSSFGSGTGRTTPAVLNLIIINTLVFVAQIVFGGLSGESRVMDLFALHHIRSDEFRPHQLITHMFMHGSVLHLLFNMFALWMFGSIVEKVWGAKRFLVFYFICGLGAAIVQLLSYTYTYRGIDGSALSFDNMLQYQTILRYNATVGASGAIMGVVAGFGCLFPNTQMFIFPIPMPVKAKFAVIGFILIDVFSGIANTPGDNVAHFAHVGGAVTGFIIVQVWNRKKRSTFY